MEEKTFYITREKLEELKKEHAELLALEKSKVLGEEAPKILASEDLNPEFVSFQEDMDKLRARLDELDLILGKHEIIKSPPKEKMVMVGLGAKVSLDIGGKEDQFMIVGTLEADPDLGKISNESPVGKALLGRKVGDQIFISTPVQKTYKIKNISYEVS